MCTNPDQYLFWDGEHPTAKVHTMIASEVMKFLGWQVSGGNGTHSVTASGGVLRAPSGFVLITLLVGVLVYIK